MLLATITRVDLFLVVAIILFAIAGVMRLLVRGFDGALVAFGLAAFGLAIMFLVNP